METPTALENLDLQEISKKRRAKKWLRSSPTFTRQPSPFKKLTKKELKKCRRELDWADSTGAWLEEQLVKFGIRWCPI